MQQNRELTMMEALTGEAAQILQDISAVISRQAHLVEQLALMQRHIHLMEDVRDGRVAPNDARREALSEGSDLPQSGIATVCGSAPAADDFPVLDGSRENSENQPSHANAAAEAEGTITAQPPEAEVVSRVPPGRTGDGAAEAGVAPFEASDAGSQADEAAGGVTVGGDESGTAAPHQEPVAVEAPPKTRKEIVLDRYAETGDDKRALAKFADSAVGSVEIYLSQARKGGDPRAAQGDLKRIQREEEPARQSLAAAARSAEAASRPAPPPPLPARPVTDSAAYKAATQPKTVHPHEDDIGKLLCRIDTGAQIVDGPDDEVPLRGPWLKVVGYLADQRRVTVEELMPMASAADRRAFDDALKRCNLALAKTGLTIHDCDGVGLFQLRKLL